METIFYVASVVAIFATIRVITHTSPIHALLYLIVSLLAISTIFFALGAYFAAALEVIVYAGAIMVLFVFVVMMLNLGHRVTEQEKAWLTPSAWLGPSILSIILFVTLFISLIKINGGMIAGHIVDAKHVGISLFGPYVLLTELASMLLLAGIVVAYHLGKGYGTTRESQVEILSTESLEKP